VIVVRASRSGSAKADVSQLCGAARHTIVEARLCFVLAHGTASEAACTASKSWR
jgi:hypothetical protein